MIFLDNASMQKPLQCAVNAFLAVPTYNPNSGHIAGLEARRALERAREEIAECLCLAEDDELYFPSCASEAAAWVLDTFEECCHSIWRRSSNHHCVTGYPYTSKLFFDDIEAELEAPNGYVEILVNNETGEINNDFQLVTEKPNDLLCIDATAAIGHMIINFAGMKCADYLFGSAQKFGGIPGVGILVVKHGRPLAWHREGTPPVGLICAMAAALKWQTERIEENGNRVKGLNVRMTDVLGAEFTTTLPYIDVGGIEKVSPYILSGRFEGVPAEALVAAASAQGVCISAGAACSTGVLEPSPALLASGLTEEEAMQTIRISFSHENTMPEVEEAGRIIRECAKSLRTIG